MPRERRAVIGAGIWTEDSFRALTPAQQQAYFLAYTQPDLNRAGVLPYRPNGWAKLAANLTARHLKRQYDALHSTRHVILDEDHQELFVRTYIGHDGLLSQPLIVTAMVRDYRTVLSPTVRLAILQEIRRLWDDTDRPTAERKGILLTLGVDADTLFKLGSDQLARIRNSIKGGLTDPMVTAVRAGTVPPFPEGLAEGHVEGLPETPFKGLPEGLVKGR